MTKTEKIRKALAIFVYMYLLGLAVVLMMSCEDMQLTALTVKVKLPEALPEYTYEIQVATASSTESVQAGQQLALIEGHYDITLTVFVDGDYLDCAVLSYYHEMHNTITFTVNDDNTIEVAE